MTETESRKLARKIAELLFAAGANHKAERLQLRDKDDRDLGGWYRAAAVNQIAKVIQEATS